MSKDSVFILGSGYSKDVAGYPTLVELSEIVFIEIKRNQSLNPSIYEYLNNLPVHFHNNIEHLMTYLYQKHPWRDDKLTHLAKAGYFWLTEILAQIFSDIENRSARKAFDHEAAIELLRFWEENKSTVITFNYDTLVERLYSRQKGEDSFVALYKIPIRHINARLFSITSGESPTSFSLLKLHGSINWHYSGEVSFPSEPIFFTSLNSENNSSHDDKSMDGLEPFIVPPMALKDFHYGNHAIMTQWSKALTAIRSAKKIYIVGYSLPQTDLATQFFLHEALISKLADSSHTPQIYIYLKENSPERLREIESNYHSLIMGNKGKVTLVNASSQESSLQHLNNQLKETVNV